MPVGLRIGSRHEIIAHVVELRHAVFVGVVAGVRAAPVVDHVVAEIEQQTVRVLLVRVAVVVVAGPRIAVAIVGVQVVMIAVAGPVAAPDQGPEAVILRIERLGDEAPLHGHVAQARLARRAREHLVQTPTGRAMIDDDLMPPADADGVPGPALIPQPLPQIANHHLIRVDPQRRIAQTDPIARRRLSGDGDEGIRDQRGLSSAGSCRRHRTRRCAAPWPPPPRADSPPRHLPASSHGTPVRPARPGRTPQTPRPPETPGPTRRLRIERTTPSTRRR